MNPALKANYPFPEKKPEVEPNDQGWFYEVNERALAPFLNADTKIIVEIGSWLGKSTRWILDKAPNAQIICIDTWLGAYEQHTERWCLSMLPKAYDTFVVNMWEYRDRVTPVRCTSEVGLNLLKRNYGIIADLIYIDGAHDYISVKRDLSTAVRLYPEAQLVGDDIQHEPLRTAVEQIAARFKLRIKTNMMQITDKAHQGCWWVDK